MGACHAQNTNVRAYRRSSEGKNGWQTARPAGRQDTRPGGGRPAAAQLVGVPDPAAIAKMCISVCPNDPGSEGSVTDATVFPAASGTEAK